MPTLPRRLLSAVVTAGLLTTSPALLGVAYAAPVPVAARPSGVEQPDQFLDDKAHGRRAIDRLGDDLDEVAALNKMSVQALERLLLSDRSIWVSTSGRLLAIDPVPAGIEPSRPEPAPFPYDETFDLHSNPGSSRTIYLDFDGQTISGTEWNDAYPTYAGPQSAPAFTLDGDPSTFNNAERDLIQSVWQRVSEDYAPFDVDVTTADPGVEALRRTSSADTVFGTRALISPSAAAASAFCGGGCGGIAYIGVFGINPAHYGVSGSDYFQPAWVFPQALGYGTKAIAEAVSHEVGHNLGLNHDGVPGTTYYGGQGSWAPIMGNSYGRPISQWSKGEYADATFNNKEVGSDAHQDDLEVITSNGLSYVADDHGNSLGAATSVTTPDRTASGLISTRGDTDWFAVPQGCAGNVTVSVTPAPTSPDLDVRLRLLAADGTQLAADNPASDGSGDVASGMAAGATVSVTSGSTLYAEVDGVGAGDPVTNGYSDYASLGRYTLTSTGCAAADPAVVAFDSATQSAGEAAGTVNMTVTRTGNTTVPATVSYARTGGTATSGNDFTLTAGTLSFAAGETTKNVPVTIADDSTDESAETVQVTLSNPGSGTSLGTTTVSTLTIIDNDDAPTAAVVAFDSATQSAGEAAGTVNMTVTRTGNTTVPATVSYARTGGTATSGNDFTLTAGTLSFAADETTKNVPVTIADDSTDESAETVQVTLSNPGAGTSLGATTVSTLTITDNDDPAPAIVAFGSADQSEDEAAGTVELTVTRTGNTSVPALVDYSRTGGTATPEDDFDLTAGTVSFSAGQTTRTVELTITDDTDEEADETVEVTLSDPGSGTGLGATTTTTVTITDDDGPSPAVVAFEAATTSVDETAGLIELTVTRTGNTGILSSVHYERTGGNTTLTDVLLGSGTLTFLPGQLERTIELTVVDDDVSEPEEDVQLTLSTPATGTVLGATSSTWVTIDRSDQQPDLLVSTRKSRGYLGGDVYGDTGAQQGVALAPAARGQLRSFFVRVHNDGTDPNLIALRATKLGKGVTVSYSNNGNDITGWMTGGTAETELAPNQFALIRVDVRIGRKAVVGSLKTVTITANWIGDTVRTDVVKGSVKVRR